MTVAPTEAIAAALAQHGCHPRRITLVSPLASRKGRRLAYRVHCHDGRTIKLREFESEEAARSAFDLNARLEDAFARVVARYGPVLVEEWVDGTALAGPEEASRLEEAGALLGRLHACPPASRRERVGTATWRRGAYSDLDMLLEAGRVSRVDGSRLRHELDARDPGETSTAIIHLDFCAENMIVDGAGALHIIDNEQLTIGPPGLDTARTYHRWPVAARYWARFDAGYLSAAAEPGAAPFWRIVATLLGARVFLQRCPERLGDSLELLQRLARGNDTPEQPSI